MTRCLISCSLLLGCGEPLIAEVGVLPQDAASSIEFAVDASAADASVDAIAVDATSLPTPNCIEIPDLAQANIGGGISSASVLVRGAEPMACFGTAVVPGIQLSRLDGAPIALANQRYALSWPRTKNSAGRYVNSSLEGSQGSCSAGEVLTTMVGASGCVEFTPSQDAQLLRIASGLLITTELSFSATPPPVLDLLLCRGACP